MISDTYCYDCGLEMLPGPHQQSWYCPLCDHKCVSVTDDQALNRMISSVDQELAATTTNKQRTAITAFLERYQERAKRLEEHKRRGLKAGPTWTHWWGSWSDYFE